MIRQTSADRVQMKMAANFSVLTLSITILAAFLCVQGRLM